MPPSICQTCGSLLRADTSVCNACDARSRKTLTDLSGITDPSLASLDSAQATISDVDRNANTKRSWEQGNFFDARSHPSKSNETLVNSSVGDKVDTNALSAFNAADNSAAKSIAKPDQTSSNAADKALSRKRKSGLLAVNEPLGKLAIAEDAFSSLLEKVSLSEIQIRSFGKAYVIVGIVVVILMAFVLFGSSDRGTILSKNPGVGTEEQQYTSISSQEQRQERGNILSGTWSLDYRNQLGKIGRGRMSLEQSAQQIAGNGVDELGQFQISGAANNNDVRFSKTYLNNGQRVGRTVSYSGRLSLDQGGQLRIDGTWTVFGDQSQGQPGNASVSGAFRAIMLHEGFSSSEQQTQQLTMQHMAQQQQQHALRQGLTNNKSVQASVQSDPDPKKSHAFFMQVALGIIGIGIALAVISLKFFGPSGLLNIWAKNEYIPSQFKAQHLKMVNEMGKPAGPGSLPLGRRDEWGWHQFWQPKELAMPMDLRMRNPHFFIIGGGAAGKSRLMAVMIAHDIQSNDRAVVLVDSDGGLADLILDWISSRPNGDELSRRVLVVDPTYDGKMFSYNPLEFPKDGDLQNAASAVVFGFKAAYTEPPGAQSQWNQQTANILRNAALLLMANNRTLADLPLLLADNDFRDVMLEKVEQMKQSRSEYITLMDAWTNYKRLARTDQWITWIEPILNRVQPMLSDPRCRRILTAPSSDLNLQRVISEKKVLIVKLPQGQLDKNGNLLGSLMVAGVKQAALSLSAQHTDKHLCSLYLDEFETFIEKETFDTITSETRKLQLALCGASKTFQTLPEDFRNNIIINVGTMAIFALAKKDADMLGPQMFRVDGRKVKHQTIQNVFNKVNTSPQFELISDEEKLNIDRVVGQERRTYFCYRVGTVAGVFRMQAPEFPNIPQDEVSEELLERMYNNRLFLRSSEDEDGDEFEQ